MKVKRPVNLLLFAFTICNVIVSGCLFKQTFDYRSANRKLILQNDSLKGVVIDLNRQIGESSTSSSVLKTPEN